MQTPRSEGKNPVMFNWTCRPRFSTVFISNFGFEMFSSFVFGVLRTEFKKKIYKAKRRSKCQRSSASVVGEPKKNLTFIFELQKQGRNKNLYFKKFFQCFLSTFKNSKKKNFCSKLHWDRTNIWVSLSSFLLFLVFLSFKLPKKAQTFQDCLSRNLIFN